MRRNRWLRPVLAILVVVALIRLAVYGPGLWETGRDFVRCNRSNGEWSSEEGGHCGNPQWCRGAGGSFTRAEDRYVCVKPGAGSASIPPLLWPSIAPTRSFVCSDAEWFRGRIVTA